MTLVLVLDIGTSSVRATLVEADGGFRAMESEPLVLMSTVPGAAEQDAQSWWAACEAVLTRIAPLCADGVSAITVTNQQVSTVPVDADGNPLAPAMLWMDQRPVTLVDGLPQTVRERVRAVVGMPASSSWAPARVLWWRAHMPEVAAAASHYLTVDAFVYTRLIGRAVTDPSNACFTLMDVRTDAYDIELARAIGVDVAAYPEILPSGTLVGVITDAVAARTGLPQGTPVVLSGSDQPCAAIGMGVIRADQVAVTTGTGTFVMRPAETALDDAGFMTNRSVAGPRHLVMGLHYVSGAAWNWFVDTVDVHGAGRAALAAELLAEVWRREPDRPAPVLIPSFSGSRSPIFDDAARATWSGMSLSTTRADLAYSVLESNGFGVRRIIDALDDALGERAVVIRLAGAPAASTDWCRLQADAIGLTCERAANAEATTLGAAMVVLLGLGAFDSIDAVTSACVRGAEVFAPLTDTASRYAVRRAILDDLHGRMKGISND